MKEERKQRPERLARMGKEYLFHRTTAPLEVRKTEAGLWQFEGYASTFGTPYELEDWLGTYTEEFIAGAFTKTLAERDDIRMLINHEDLPLARTKSGTLRLSQDDIGLLSSSDLEPSDPDVQRIVPKMQRKDLDEMSIAFRAIRQEWDEDYTWRKLLEALLYDVSIVTFPGNPYTSASLRDAGDLIEALSDFSGRDLSRELLEVRSGRVFEPGKLQLAVRTASNLVRALSRTERRQADDEAAEEDEEITDLMVLEIQLGAALMQVQQMLAEEEQDEGGAGDGTQDLAKPPAAERRDSPATMRIDMAQRHLDLLRLGAR